MDIKNKEMRPASFRPFMREDTQLIIEPSAAYTDEVNPLSACHEKFSRFNICVINRDHQSSTMNMRWFSDTPETANSYVEFRELAKLAKELHIRTKNTPAKGASTPAFTLVFKAGRDLQGKTAAQVLKERPDGREILASQREFLLKNVAKYRNNQSFIDAIDEALNLTQDQINTASDSVELTLFQSGLRSNAYKTKNGKCLCYTGWIKFYPGADSPLKVSVENFYASTQKDEKGLSKILLDTAEGKTQGSINLNFGESLRLFAELEEYFSIKFEELSNKGISESEKMLAAQRQNSDERGTKPSVNPGPASQTAAIKHAPSAPSAPIMVTEKTDLPTPETQAIELRTQSVLSDDGNGNLLLKAIDRRNHVSSFIFPKKYWESKKYGKVGEQFRSRASSEDGIAVILHFYVYNDKKYVAKIGR